MPNADYFDDTTPRDFARMWQTERERQDVGDRVFGCLVECWAQVFDFDSGLLQSIIGVGLSSTVVGAADARESRRM